MIEVADNGNLEKETLFEDESVKFFSLVPPIRFNHVSTGITRGAYPTLRNFRFLSRLQLKTIISLTPEPPTADLVLLAEMASIKLVHLSVGRMAGLSDALKATLVSAVNLCIEAKNHPVYVHCLDGRRISSLLVLLLRRVQGWTPLASLSEYWRFQATFRSPIPTIEVEKTTRELEIFASQCSDIVIPESMPKWLWGGDRCAVVPGVTIKLGPVKEVSAVAAAAGEVVNAPASPPSAKAKRASEERNSFSAL